MKRFWEFSKRYILAYKWWYIIGGLLIAVTQGISVAIIEQIKAGIDAVGVEGATAETIFPFVTSIVFLALALMVVRTGSRLLIFTPGRLIEYKIRNDYYSKLLHLQRVFYKDHESGDLVSRCSNDIGAIRAAYGFAFLQVANVAITFSFVLVAMLNMDLQTTFFIAIPMVVAFAVLQGSISYMLQYWVLANEQIGGLSSLCLASYKGISAIQNYHAEPAMEARFFKENEAYLNTQTVVTKIRSFTMPVVKLVTNLSVFLILWFVGPKVIRGDLTLGEITAFLGYISMIMPPLLSLGWMLNVFSRALPAMDRLDEILLAEPNLPPVKAALEKDQPVYGFEARNLNFRFPDDNEEKHFELKDINFKLPRGKVLGIVGPVASGKTALIETLLRLNQPPMGSLFINGVDANDLDLGDYRAVFSFVPQRSMLFSTSLRDNLRMALPAEQWYVENLDETLGQFLEIACFKLDPKQFPLGLDTQVGSKGVMLSGGQRQRIALARALLKPAEIYVLDDVLSAVDHETERQIIENLRRFAPGKSFLIASHRVSAVQWADEILVMNQGRLVDQGRHEELAAKPGFYRDIFEYQSQKMEKQA